MSAKQATILIVAASIASSAYGFQTTCFEPDWPFVRSYYGIDAFEMERRQLSVEWYNKTINIT